MSRERPRLTATERRTFSHLLNPHKKYLSPRHKGVSPSGALKRKKGQPKKEMNGCTRGRTHCMLYTRKRRKNGNPRTKLAAAVAVAAAAASFREWTVSASDRDGKGVRDLYFASRASFFAPFRAPGASGSFDPNAEIRPAGDVRIAVRRSYKPRRHFSFPALSFCTFSGLS